MHLDVDSHIYFRCVVLGCSGLHSGGATRHRHTATPSPKYPADLGDGVGEQQAGETGTDVSE